MFSLAILGTKMAAWSRDHVELCAQLGERKLSGSAGSLVLLECARRSGQTCFSVR